MKKSMVAIKLLMVGLAGCSTSPYYDKHFGEAVRSTLTSQYINPNPPASTSVTAMDGRTSREIINNYYRGYSTPSQNNSAFSFQVGGGNANGSGTGNQ